MTITLASIKAIGDDFYNPLTLVDLAGVDQPLVYVNRAFEGLTGYPRSEILGRNCRFLQGTGTAASDVGRVRAAIADGRAIFCDLLNFRKDGRSFYNRLVLLPLELAGRPHFIGMQIDASPLLAQALSSGQKFDDLKTSEEIRDRINTPLMNIWSALSLTEKVELREQILHRAFRQIVETVRSLPFRGSRS